jgi:hypothetical protein
MKSQGTIAEQATNSEKLLRLHAFLAAAEKREQSTQSSFSRQM